MPLEHGKSKKAFEHNVKAEMHAGKSQKQSLAIAYALKRKAQHHKMAHGGMMTHDGYQSECTEHCESPCMIHEQASGYEPMPHEHEMHNKMAMHEDHRMLNQHGEDEEGPEGHAHHMAHGGMMSPMHGEQGPEHEEDMVGHIMKKRQHMYSKGGIVANEGEDELDHMADGEENEFDDLVKDDHLEEHYTGANSGDEDGNEYDADHDDMVAKIMMKRRKQKNPNPA